jgi:hypothetical protein
MKWHKAAQAKIGGCSINAVYFAIVSSVPVFEATPHPVDGKLTAHYYGWNLRDIDVDDDDSIGYGFLYSEDDWPTEHLFARGFCRWIERAFQPILVELDPDQTWLPGYGELETQVARPATLLIEWQGGAR